jgi:hypothetical protein
MNLAELGKAARGPAAAAEQAALATGPMNGRAVQAARVVTACHGPAAVVVPAERIAILQLAAAVGAVGTRPVCRAIMAAAAVGAIAAVTLPGQAPAELEFTFLKYRKAYCLIENSHDVFIAEFIPDCVVLAAEEFVIA